MKSDVHSGTSVSSHDRVLRPRTCPGKLCRALSDGMVQCLACAHRCVVRTSRSGRCGVRWNDNGVLRVPYGYVSSLAVDPIEKKPLYHFLPGEEALSFGMLGCNFHCEFCQNWHISQTCRDPDADTAVRDVTLEQFAQIMDRCAARVLASTYNEPLISTEWGVDLFRLAKEKGLRTCYVSNGFASPEAAAFLEPWLDALNIDLKCFTEAGYRRLGGALAPVKETVRAFQKLGKWVEVTTLIVPGFNNSRGELTAIAEFLADVSSSIPWHVSAYHADYRMQEGPGRTSSTEIQMAIDIGHEAGLAYVYAGNIASREGSATRCPHCGELLIERSGYRIRILGMSAKGTCERCGTAIPGVWSVDHPGCP